MKIKLPQKCTLEFYYPNQAVEHFHHHLKKFPFAPFQSTTALTQKPLSWFLSPYLSFACSCIFYKWHHRVNICVWLLLLWIIFLSFIYIIVWIISSFLLWKKLPWTFLSVILWTYTLFLLVQKDFIKKKRFHI